MAGIGFDLKRIFIEEDGGSPKIGVAIKSAFATSGPWMSSVVFLAVTKIFISKLMSEQEFITFMSISIYGFVFSMAISSSVSYMATRKLADILYLKEYQNIVKLFLESAVALMVISFCVSFAFIKFYTALYEHWFLICSFFCVMSVLWLIMVFVSSMRDFNTVFFAFAAGLIISFVALFFYGYKGAMEALFSFSVGISVTIGALFAILVKEFGYEYSKFKFEWLKDAKLYLLFFSGFFFFAGMWADKVIYWFDSGFGIETIKGFYFFSAYDFAIFISYLTLIPSVAYFSVFVETVFYDELRAYMSAIEHKKDLWHIRVLASALVKSFSKSIFNVFIFQFIIALLFMLFLTPVFDYYKISPESIPLLRISLFCALLQLMLQVIVIFIYYFDFQKEAFFVTFFSFLCNTFLTYVLKDWGFAFVGYSYFISLYLSIIMALAIAYYKLSRINFYVFMGQEIC